MFAIFPEILHLAAQGNLETLACSIRKYFGERQIYAPRLRVDALLAQMGISLSRELAPNFARIQVLDHKGQYHVTVTLDSRLQDGWEINFSLAHLLGYFLLEIQPLMARGEVTAEVYQLESGALHHFLSTLGTVQRGGKNPARQAADQFAVALLLPIGMVKKAYEKLGSTKDTAGFFHVNPALVEHRLRAIGLDQGPARVRETAPEPAKPAAPLASPKRAAVAPAPARKPPVVQEHSSRERVQRSVAQLSYKREDSQTVPRERESSKPAEGGGDGLKRLRELAKKIDRSVDV